MLLPKENEKKITTHVVADKGKKKMRKGRSEMDTNDENYGMGKKGIRSMKKKKDGKGGKKKGKKAKC